MFPQRSCKPHGVYIALILFLILTWGAAANEETPKSANDSTEKPVEKIRKSDAEWKKQLTPRQYRVTRRKETETAYTGTYWNTKKDGVYQCICCEQPLFDSRTKFDSQTGWPSFWQPIAKPAVEYHDDRSDGTLRTEVMCSRCDAHLGHVFNDGPAPTGLRFCMNSASLKRVEREGVPPEKATKSKRKKRTDGT